MPLKSLPPHVRVRLDPLVTPLFRTWWRLSRSMTLGVRGIACDSAGRVALVRHTYRAGWYLPGGGVERGETTLEALCREMAEEAGIAPIAAPVLAGIYSNHHRFPNDHVALYHVQSWEVCAPANDGEIDEIGFFALDDLPEGATESTRARLAEVFKGAPVRAVW